MQNQTTPHLPTLPMHLMLNMGYLLSLPLGLQCAKNAWLHLKQAENVKEEEAEETANKLQKLVLQEAKSQTDKMIAGIRRYYDTPYSRNLNEAPCVWQKFSARLLDYGQGISEANSVVLFVPSLINRYYILDLSKERSFLRYLARQGVYPLVLDWGIPSKREKNFDCADYITEILLPAVDFISKISASKIDLAGYCMGGVMALAAAKIKPDKISSLSLFATPWNFHCSEFMPFILDKKWHKELEKQIKLHNTVPAAFIQSLFYLTDPFLFEQKFRRYAETGSGSINERDFLALEHWVNDGVPMPSKVAVDCLIEWVQSNILAKGKWSVKGKKISSLPASMPVFMAIPKNDGVVPFECAMPLANTGNKPYIIHPKAGHVGMIVGRNAKRELWQPYCKWLISSDNN